MREVLTAHKGNTAIRNVYICTVLGRQQVMTSIFTALLAKCKHLMKICSLKNQS